MNHAMLQTILSVGLAVVAGSLIALSTYAILDLAAVGLGGAVACLGTIMAFIEGRLTQIADQGRESL